MTKAIGYIRVSTDDQRLGPEAQRADLLAWAEREGVDLVAVFEDIGVSGAAPIEKRPGLCSAMAALEDFGAEYLVAAKRDRLARNVMISALIEQLVERAGARVHALDDGKHDETDPMALVNGQLMRGIKDVLAQYERALIRARTTAALAVKRTRGERIGGLPMGSTVEDDGVKLTPDTDEQAAIDRMHELRGKGLTVRAIAQRLDEEGFRPRGKRWHKSTVHAVLQRKAA